SLRIHHQPHPPALVVEAGAIEAGVVAGAALAEHADLADRHQFAEPVHVQAEAARHQGSVDFDVRTFGKLKGDGLAHGLLHAGERATASHRRVDAALTWVSACHVRAAGALSCRAAVPESVHVLAPRFPAPPEPGDADRPWPGSRCHPGPGVA